MKTSLLNENFLGKYVQIITDNKIKSIKHFDDHSVEEEHPVSMEGFLVDADDNYFYLGQEQDKIDGLLDKKKTVYIHIIGDSHPSDQLLDDYFKGGGGYSN